ncbi:siderophore-iron reductase FhuF [Pseudomonas petrae]|uniref:Siderophore-iron reductase FhuF n=1 Tax=Pseudomonas petrae TaxID=2912190 RepID=A0ABS9IA24_9PSED|nr:siderophore-iron reductase FhuF [Pseudomonas petrae]MCF7532576.1 siderophore-iron reductase FhuF [Pseudomonas petrae]MCF7539007.1 siderophore-iron reductase FhuF [Pseudomonas petrae]MCF7544595.1 siderophore-iron reductase FhuF [Pseudomonas petrae]MCF7556948.1 siderophore-iron reductase FhuF [Pseudomonas petrae]
MIPALAPLFIADFEHYRDVLVLPDDPLEGVPMRTFLTGDYLDDVLTRFGTAYPDSDPRGLASIWSKHYFIKLIPPMVAASLILNQRLPLSLDHLQLILDDDGLPAGFKLPHSGQRWMPAPADPFERFGELLDHHIRPFIEALARHVSLSPKVLWSNAGNYFEWLLGVLANAMPHADVSHGHQLLNALYLPDGSRNPLFQPVRYIKVDRQDELKRQRRVCCIRYRVNGLDYCGNCPLS